MTTGKFSTPADYNGITFRSHLEAAYARFFDQLKITWAFEPEGYCFDGQWYLPDFALPELKTIFEVKGMMDTTDCRKLGSIARPAAQAGVTVIVGESPVGRLGICRPSPLQPDSCFSIDYRDTDLVLCATCRHVYFRDLPNGWACQHCGSAGGNAHILHLPEYVDCWTPRGTDLPQDGDTWPE